MQPDEAGRRHRGERGDLGAEREQRRDELAAGCLVAHVRDLDDDQVAAAQELGDLLDRRELEDAADRGDLVGRRLGPVAPGGEHVAGLLPRPDQPAGEDLVQREQLELDRRDDAEVAAASAQREEQVALVRVVDAVELAVGRDDLDRRHVVRREAVLAREPAHAAAERVADDADVGRGAVQGHEAVLGRGDDDVLPEHAGADAGAAAPRRRSARCQLARAGSGRRRERSPSEATLWPVPCAATRRPWAAANRTAAWTSCELLGTAIRRGLLVERQVPGGALAIPAIVSGSQDRTAHGMTQGFDVDVRSGGRAGHDGPRFPVSGATARVPGRSACNDLSIGFQGASGRAERLCPAVRLSVADAVGRARGASMLAPERLRQRRQRMLAVDAGCGQAPERSRGGRRNRRRPRFRLRYTSARRSAAARASSSRSASTASITSSSVRCWRQPVCSRRREVSGTRRRMSS